MDPLPSLSLLPRLPEPTPAASLHVIVDIVVSPILYILLCSTMIYTIYAHNPLVLVRFVCSVSAADNLSFILAAYIYIYEVELGFLFLILINQS